MKPQWNGSYRTHRNVFHQFPRFAIDRSKREHERNCPIKRLSSKVFARKPAKRLGNAIVFDYSARWQQIADAAAGCILSSLSPRRRGCVRENEIKLGRIRGQKRHTYARKRRTDKGEEIRFYGQLALPANSFLSFHLSVSICFSFTVLLHVSICVSLSVAPSSSFRHS